MRENDNIKTYFNSDKMAGISDCIKLPNGVYVQFSSDNFELRGRPSTSECNHIGHKQSHRTPMHIHAASCHAGRERATSSRITIDGEAVPRLPATELCKGCALGGTQREHREGVSTRRNVPKESKVAASFFGQHVCNSAWPTSRILTPFLRGLGELSSVGYGHATHMRKLQPVYGDGLHSSVN